MIEETSAVIDASDDEQYTVRPYEPRDRGGFLSLYESVFGDGNHAWFDWKYGNNPYTDHVPVIVAEGDDGIVGAKPAFALRLRVGERSLLALQPCDTMVHPEHRRRGIYSTMLEFQKDVYRDSEAALFFNFPNPASMPGSLKAGWRSVTEMTTYYRVQNPLALLGDSDDRTVFRAGADALAGVTSVYLHARDRLLPPSIPDGLSVERHDGIPASTLARLYERAVPRAIHAVRDEQFYRWRFENPQWTYRCYTARRDGVPVAGIVTGTRTEAGLTTTNLVDAVPRRASEDREEAFAALLARAVREHADADVLAIRGDVPSRSLLSRRGFRADRSFPLSLVSSPSTLVTRPSTDEGLSTWAIDGIDLLDESNWSLSYSELDSA